MTLLDCQLDTHTQCIHCPAIPFVPAQPPHVEYSAMVGWNAGADSVTVLDDDLHTVYQINSAVGGVVCGLKRNMRMNWIPELIDYGFFFQLVAGILFVSVVELGVTQVSNVEYDTTATFEVRRVGTQVLYLVKTADGTTVLYRSTTPSFGTLFVNGCLYISSDQIA